MPTLWIDADACPRAAREIIVRAAERTRTRTWMVANHALPLPPSAWVKSRAGADVMTTRGERLTGDNIRARVQMRDFMETLRASGEQTRGPNAYSDGDRREFANALDSWLRRHT